MTPGEKIVRTDLNVSSKNHIDDIQQLTAKLINMIAMMEIKDRRLAAIAITKYEEACMFAVKLATTDNQ